MRKIALFALLVMIVLSACKPKAAYKATLIEFMDKGCSACETIKPDIEALKKEFKGLVDFQIYDVRNEASNAVTAMYKMNGTPTLIFLDENKMEYFRLEKTIQKDVIAAILMTKTGPPVKK